MSRLLGALDQGTTSTRFIVFDAEGHVVAMAQREHRQIYPEPGWVEHDPLEIWANSRAVIAEAVDSLGSSANGIAAIGITNQRETTVVWDRRTGHPLCNAIVWQDTRTASAVRELAAYGDDCRAKTGLPLATYFSSLKSRWILDHVAGARELAEAGQALIGTVDSYLMWNLTGGRHLTDVTNASRTQLMNLKTLDWDDDLCSRFGVPRAALPEIRSSSGDFGTIASGPLAGVPIAGVLGDQQAALMGQACFLPGEAKNTYGTGCFLLMNTGDKPVLSKYGLLTTVAYRLEGQAPVYALEGSVAIAGALVQWLRDNLGIIANSGEVESLAASVADNGGVYFVPAFSGLFAPYWRDDARGTVVGLTRYANRAHIARAALEATAFQTWEVLDAMERESGIALDVLRVDGGMVANNLLMQFQADIAGCPVVRPEVSETTALGAAYAAGLAVGVYSGLDELRSSWREYRRWQPTLSVDARQSLRAIWKKAVQRSLDWA